MSSPYPPHPPAPQRKLTRSTTNRFIGGVCGGVAQYLNMDANLVRILTVALTLFTGVPIVLYIVAMIIVPEDVGYVPPPVQAAQPPPGADPVWGAQGAPWEQPKAAAPTEEPKAEEPKAEEPKDLR